MTWKVDYKIYHNLNPSRETSLYYTPILKHKIMTQDLFHWSQPKSTKCLYFWPLQLRADPIQIHNNGIVLWNNVIVYMLYVCVCVCVCVCVHVSVRLFFSSLAIFTNYIITSLSIQANKLRFISFRSQSSPKRSHEQIVKIGQTSRGYQWN